jgi:TIR domain-containing protein
MAHDVFISHSERDRNVADAACTRLEESGIKCWIAHRDVLPGKPYGGAIVEAIRAARLMVVVFSSGSNKSQHVLREVECAANNKVTIILFRIENVPPSADLEYYTSAYHWLDVTSAPPAARLERLTQGVQRLIGLPTRDDEKLPHHDEKPPPNDREPPRNDQQSPKTSWIQAHLRELFVGLGAGLSVALLTFLILHNSNRPAVPGPGRDSLSGRAATGAPAPADTAHISPRAPSGHSKPKPAHTAAAAPADSPRPAPAPRTAVVEPTPVVDPSDLRTNQAPAIAGVGSDMYIFATAVDGRIFYDRATLGQGGQGWVEVDGGGRASSGPSAGAVGDHVYVGVRSTDGQVLLNQADRGRPFSQWNSLGFATDVAPAVTGAGNTVLVFAVQNQRIYMNQAVLGQGFRGWVEVEGNGRTDAAPGAGAVGSHIFLAIKSVDGQMYLNQADLGHPFGQWFSQNMTTDVSPGVTGVGDNIYFFGTSRARRVFYNRAVLGQGGQGWVEIDGDARSTDGVGAGAVRDHVFVGIRAPDGRIRINQADLGKPFGSWQP